VACARVHVPFPESYWEQFRLGECFSGEFARPEAHAFFSRFMVRKSHRGRRPGGEVSMADQLYEAAALAAMANGAKFLDLNCTPALTSLYERKGWVRYCPCFFDENMGLQVAMALPLDDVAFLSKVEAQGPFAQVASRFEGERTTPTWLPSLLESRPNVLVSSKGLYESDLGYLSAFRELATSRYPGYTDVDMFQGTSAEERAELFSGVGGAMCIADVKQGTLITRAGDVRDEAFLILSGEVSMSATDDSGHVVAVGPGEIVGEVAFLSGQKRCQSARAVTDVELMVLSRVFLQKSMVATPHITVKLLYNLAVLLAKRYMILTTALHAAMADARRQSSGVAEAELSRVLTLTGEEEGVQKREGIDDVITQIERTKTEWDQTSSHDTRVVCLGFSHCLT